MKKLVGVVLFVLVPILSAPADEPRPNTLPLRAAEEGIVEVRPGWLLYVHDGGGLQALYIDVQRLEP